MNPKKSKSFIHNSWGSLARHDQRVNEMSVTLQPYASKPTYASKGERARPVRGRKIMPKCASLPRRAAFAAIALVAFTVPTLSVAQADQ
jgi:hypothetical protein